MAKGGGVNIVGLVFAGGALVMLYEGVLIVTGMEPIIKPDPIHDFLLGLIPGGGGNGNGNGNGGTATATPDKPLYAAGDTITVTGSGFNSGESVGCRYTSGGTLVQAKEVTADAAGALTVTFAFTAGGHVNLTGRTSGKTASALINDRP